MGVAIFRRGWGCRVWPRSRLTYVIGVTYMIGVAPAAEFVLDGGAR